MNIKKNILLGFVINIISIVGIYITMQAYAKEISANCMDCSYIQDVLINSITILIFPIIYITYRFISSKSIALLVISFYAIINVFVGQIGIFNSRVASWSSYTKMNVVVGVFLEQYLSLILILGIFISIIKIVLFKSKIYT